MLDHRLEEFDSSNSKPASSISKSDSIAANSQLPTQPIQPSPKKTQSTKKSSSWLRRGWNNLGFRSKLTLLLVGSATIPVLIVTQSLVNLNKARTLDDLKRTLQLQGQTFANEYVLWTQVDTETQAENIAKLIQATELDLNNPAQIAARQQLLADYLIINENQENPELTKSFKIITDAQGRTVAQNIVIVDDSSNAPIVPAANQELQPPKYRKVSIPTRTSISDIPIVKNALSTGQALSGIELVKSQSLQKLGLEKQANLGLRTQPIRNLPDAKKPAPEGTYDIDGGKAGLLSMAVHPIKINNKLVGTVVIGTLFNRNYGLVDKFSQSYNVPVATVFAKDWRVVTNVPYTDGKTRAIGTRVAREVADKVLNKQEEFVGETNIVGRQYLTYYSPLYDHQKELNPDQAKPVGIAFIGESLSEAQAITTRQQLVAYSIGGSLLLLIGLVSIPIASSFSRPMRRLSDFAQEVAAGNEKVALEVSDERYDEIGILSKEMNTMAKNISANLEARRQEADRARILKDITVQISQAVDSQTTLKVAVEEIRAAIKSDRIVIYSFDKNWKGTVTFESVADSFPKALSAEINDPCFAQGYVDKYLRGRVQATENIYTAGLTECHIKQLEQFAVKANLVAPIVSNGQLIALLIAHQCSAPRAWQQSEIGLFAQLATQVGLALDRVSLLEQQKAAKEQLQRRALELLMEVDPLTQGDLTIRASVTEDEIGTIADSYNATIASLRQIVNQVQTAAQQVALTTTTKESSVSELSQEALRQAEEITAAVAQIQEMASLIRAVAANAEQAEAAVQQASQTVSEGDVAMNRTVDGILAIRETVAQTSKKVKRLGESSQKISKVVNLIGTFADQTNLLALNAAIEAANAGEQGRGFAVVAERVRSLARQSTEATAEIEKLVTDIQTETNEVVSAMEAGTEQVVAGTRLVDETRQSLNKISEVSNQINELVKAIATATVDQSKASEEVTQTMTDVAQIANKTSTEATQVSESFKELLAVAQQLQASASQFKVN